MFKALFSFKKSEITETFKQAKLKEKKLGLKLLQAPTNNLYEHGKLLIVIPKKSGSAYIRNKIRRQLKSIFYEEKLYKKKVLSILFVYKQGAELSFDDLKAFLIENI